MKIGFEALIHRCRMCKCILYEFKTLTEKKTTPNKDVYCIRCKKTIKENNFRDRKGNLTPFKPMRSVRSFVKCRNRWCGVKVNRGAHYCKFHAKGKYAKYYE